MDISEKNDSKQWNITDQQVLVGVCEEDVRRGGESGEGLQYDSILRECYDKGRRICQK